MCTTGVLRLAEDEYLLFKNKDFVRSHFDDRLVIEPELFGVQGVITWAGTDPDSDRFSGFSIGANANGLLCCDSNVQTVEDHANYDDLVAIALRQGTDIASAVAAVRSSVEQTAYIWANLIMIDAIESVSLEIRGNRMELTPLDGPTARANHHFVLGAHPDDDDTTTSQQRYESAQRRLQGASSLDDILELQGSHDDGDTGVCNHSLYQTVYSYVLRHKSGTTSLYVVQGHPCRSPIPEERLLPIGRHWSVFEEAAFRAAYPSARSLQPA